MSDEIELYPGDPGDPETGDGWKPRVALEQADPRGVGVIVGETAEGYAEGIDPETFEAMAKHLAAMGATPNVGLELDEDEVVALRRSVGRYLTRVKEQGPPTALKPAETLYEKVVAVTGGQGEVFACKR